MIKVNIAANEKATKTTPEMIRVSTDDVSARSRTT